MTADPVVPEPRDPRYLLLAEMFHGLPPEAHHRMMSAHGEPTDSSYQELVAYAAATPAGARLLALAADGAAVERLPVGKCIRVGASMYQRWYRVEDESGDILSHAVEPAAAVEAALGEQGGQADG